MAGNPPIGILLAAGFSRRFGHDDKLLHPLPDGTPVGLAAARNLIRALPWSVAVVRPDNDALAELLHDAGLAVLRCPAEALGMGDSLSAGVRHARRLHPATTGFVIALGDMPSILPATIAAVAHRLDTGAALAAPLHQGRRGHPVGFSAAFADALEALHGDEGARSLLERHRERMVLVECSDPGVLLDIDTPEDLPQR